jgi:hypothetical protein
MINTHLCKNPFTSGIECLLIKGGIYSPGRMGRKPNEEPVEHISMSFP